MCYYLRTHLTEAVHGWVVRKAKLMVRKKLSMLMCDHVVVLNCSQYSTKWCDDGTYLSQQKVVTNILSYGTLYGGSGGWAVSCRLGFWWDSCKTYRERVLGPCKLTTTRVRARKECQAVLRSLYTASSLRFYAYPKAEKSQSLVAESLGSTHRCKTFLTTDNALERYGFDRRHRFLANSWAMISKGS